MALVWDDNRGEWVEDGSGGGPTTGQRKFNPSADWKDTNSAPNPSDPYYQQWRDANPGIPESQAAPVGRQIKSHNQGGTQYYDGSSDGPGGNAYTGSKDFKSLVNYWQKNHPASNPDMDGLINFLKENGISATRARHANNTLTSEDKLIYEGKTWDVGSSLGSSGGSWFPDFSAEGDGGMGSGDKDTKYKKFTGNDPGIDPRFLTPWDEPVPRTPPKGTFAPPTFNQPDKFASTPFQAPTPFSYPEMEKPDPFKAPTLAEAQQEPGYEFALKEGLRALEQSAAGRGVLRTGGTLKGLVNYGQAAAEGNYQNVFNRGLQTYDTNLGAKINTYNTNRGNAFQNYGMNFNNSLAAHQQNSTQGLSDYLTNYGVSKDAFDYLYRGSKDTYDSEVLRNQTEYDRLMNEYNKRYDIFRNNKNDAWDKMKWLTDMGNT